jgi:hypothetical protein
MGWLTDLADNAMADGVPVAGISGVNMQAAPRPAPLSTAGPAPPLLSPAAEARRRKVLAMLARDGGQYAVAVDDAGTDPIIRPWPHRTARVRYSSRRTATIRSRSWRGWQGGTERSHNRQDRGPAGVLWEARRHPARRRPIPCRGSCTGGPATRGGFGLVLLCLVCQPEGPRGRDLAAIALDRIDMGAQLSLGDRGELLGIGRIATW